MDCEGICNGNAELDCAGVCNGDDYSCADCYGNINGDAELDYCGVCDGDGSTCGEVTFTKENFADWILPENQDCITENVCITRADYEGIFNAMLEDGYEYYGGSPTGTGWAFGNTEDLSPKARISSTEIPLSSPSSSSLLIILPFDFFDFRLKN